MKKPFWPPRGRPLPLCFPAILNSARPTAIGRRITAAWPKSAADGTRPLLCPCPRDHHRDIKPSNLLLDTGGRRLGHRLWPRQDQRHRANAHRRHPGNDSLHVAGAVQRAVRCPRRRLLLGLTLYELLTLKPAFESPDRLKLIDMVAKTEASTPRSLDSRIPLDLETIILKASDKDPKRRYQSADDMAEDLQRFVNDEPILARRTTTIERLARWSRRNPGLATSMSLAIIGLVAVTVMSFFYARDQRHFAQQQNDLNNELTTANEKQKELFEEQQRLKCRAKPDDRRVAGGQITAGAQAGGVRSGNRQHRRGMSWLAHSLELASPEETAFRDDVWPGSGSPSTSFPDCRRSSRWSRNRRPPRTSSR